MSLYIHFPWCVKKCPYCDFNSHALRGEIPEDEYIAALIRDLDWELQSFPVSRLPLREARLPADENNVGRPSPVSLFLGGGTPSLFSGKAIGRLLEAVRARLAFAPDIEITLEANPGTADAANFAAYRAAGVNRLSIGAQSLNDKHLKALGRIHGADDARRAVALARAAGFDNINLDLMYALPRQTPAEAEADIRAACALAPEHLSYYQLTLEPNTEFHARPPPLPDHDAAWNMQEAGVAIMAEHGYAQYEVSAYSKPNRRCRHNLNYWEFGDYIGIGAGAHGKITGDGRPETGDARQIVRRARHKLPRQYLEHAGTSAVLQEDRVLVANDLPFEFAMNALRLNQGFTRASFEARTGASAVVLDQALGAARQQGLLERQGDSFRPSARGRAFLNPLLQLFLP